MGPGPASRGQDGLEVKGISRLARIPVRVALAIAFALSACPPAAPVAADPLSPPAPSATQQQISSVLAQRQKVEAEISLLDPQLEAAQEEYNGALVQLDRTTAELEQSTAALGQAQTSLASQRDAFNRRFVSLYKNGQYGGVDLLLSTSNVPELIARLDFLVKLGDRDAEVLRSMAEEEQAAEISRDQLATLQQQQTVLELKAAQRKNDAEKMLAERQALLASLDQQFRDLLDQQSKEQQAQQVAMLAEIKANGAKYGIAPQPGSPVETALQYIGVPYVWGGDSPKGFDCSGLVMYVLRQHGVELPHYSGAQFDLGIAVTLDQLLPGDLVFFGSPVHHVGMYIGGGYFVHAPHTGDFVRISKLADRGDFAGARRYPWIYNVPGGTPGQPPSGQVPGQATGE
jgi:peptidoglycan DL-endopeptidase CwlO